LPGWESVVLRLVSYQLPDGKLIRVLTDRFDLSALSIAQLYKATTWKVSSFAGRQSLRLSGWHQHLQHFIAGFALGKIPLA
jgi:hypothetical protein